MVLVEDTKRAPGKRKRKRKKKKKRGKSDGERARTAKT